MKENKGKSYVLYIRGVEAFEKYKIPNVELIEIKKFTDKQLVNIAKGDMFPIAKHYNKKLYKMLIKEFGNKTNVCDIWIDSSIANLSFELFDKKQNLHTFKVHTEDSALDFKAFKTKKEIGRGNTAPFIFMDSFTGPGLYSGRRTMCTSQYENIFNAAREFGNRYVEINGDCPELLNPDVGKKDSDNGCLKDRPGRVKYVEEETNKEPIIDVNYDKSETGDNGFSWNISVKVPDCINYEDDWNIYQNVAGEFVVRNCYRHKNLASAIEFMKPISGSVNNVIIITEEVDTDMIGAVVYTKEMEITSPWVRVDSISDAIKLMTILLHLHTVIAKKSVWRKLKNNDTEKEQPKMQCKTEEVEKSDEYECTFKFNVGGFTEKDCSLSELADKIDEIKQGDSISAKIKFAHNQLEMNLINKIAEILNSDYRVSSSLVANDKVAMILHEVEHYKFQKDFDGDRVNVLSINHRNPEITKANKIIVGNTYILNGNNNLGELKVIGFYVGQPVLVLQKEPSGLCLVQFSNGQKFGSIPSDSLSPFCKQDNKKPSESMIGGKYILNGSNDIGIDAEIRPYIGKKVVVTKLHKNGLFSIMCNKEGEEKVFNGIAKYNLTPLSKEDSNSTENFDTFSEISNPIEALTKWMYNGVPEETETEIKVECNATFPTDYDGATPEKSTLGKILTKHMIGIEKLKSDSDVVVTKLHKDDDNKRVNYTPECSIPLADKEIASKTVEEVSEYLDNAEYDLVVNKITKDISMHYRHVKIAGRHMFSIPSDFRERLCDLSYLPDLENRFKQFDNIGILQQELLLKSKDEDMLESIEELTFAQVLELFTVLADMKGMIKIKDEESGEYCLKHLEKKAELIANDIKVADILVDEDEYLKVINFINSNVSAENLSNNIMFYRYDIVVPKDFKERITSLLDSPDYKNKFKFISDPRKYLTGILYLTTSDIDIAHHQLGKLTFEQLLELFTILADVSLDAPVELGELNANSQAQDRTKRARPTNMKVEVYPTTTSSEEGEVNPLTNDEVNK